MNAMYVTVSIPFLLVLAGFNHAYGLTTFGKSGGSPQTPQPPTAKPKSCDQNNQTYCYLIKGTTCIDGQCLCGNNKPPYNGKCPSTAKGPGHLCVEEKECVDYADCILASDIKNKALVGLQANDKLCQCQEGFTPANSICAGGARLIFVPGILIMLMVLSRTLY